MVPMGACLGAFLSGSILDVFDRRQSLMFTDLLTIIGVALGEIINLYVLSISRIILGIAVGLNSALVPLTLDLGSSVHP
jgi:predicted MFS family arabinose efflux permease